MHAWPCADGACRRERCSYVFNFVLLTFCIHDAGTHKTAQETETLLMAGHLFFSVPCRRHCLRLTKGLMPTSTSLKWLVLECLCIWMNILFLYNFLPTTTEIYTFRQRKKNIQKSLFLYPNALLNIGWPVSNVRSWEGLWRGLERSHQRERHNM